MRSAEQISRIESRIIEPYKVDNFLSSVEITHLLNLFKQTQVGKIHKNTGPITLNLEYFLHDSIVDNIFTKLVDLIGDFQLTSSFFFKVTFPHIIHNDDVFDLPDVYRGITLPLECQGSFTEYPKLCFFDQFYFHGPAKFFNGSKDIPTYYNKQVYEYSDVSYKSDKPIDPNIKEQYFTHLKDNWLEGLSFKSAIDWKPGSAIIFDSTRLHCASDFRKLDITSKTAISIFTKTS